MSRRVVYEKKNHKVKYLYFDKQKVKNVLERGKNFNKWGGKNSPKLHKYTLKLYNYAILQGTAIG